MANLLGAAPARNDTGHKGFGKPTLGKPKKLKLKPLATIKISTGAPKYPKEAADYVR